MMKTINDRLRPNGANKQLYVADLFTGKNN